MSYDLSFDKKHAALLGLCALVIAALLVVAGFLLGVNHADRSVTANSSLPLPVQPPSLPPAPAKKGSAPQAAAPASAAAPAPSLTTANEYPPPASPSPSLTTTQAAFSLQFGAFQEKANADSLIKQLKADNITATVFMAQDNAGRTWYAVRSGAYATLPEASASAESLRATTHQPILVRPAHAL